ncbi:polyprenyl synthetase family protein [Ligilactobacillus apodemi]|uniref:polyprenyl synthetase family protein n=1 Tax=Ligilactobacillus apodemi TaxID=307126 RepID=UPI00214B66E1|nr:farnesyl diphosphate synthase [Ligilactobacillus apodemi]MCR1900628.1 polyprenyl synthetase family protein [Ligilactobacillus apodemi]
MEDKTQLADFQAEVLPQLETHMGKHLATLNSAPKLKKAMSYSIEAGGKRIRPLMILLICQARGRVLDDDVLSVAGSLEFMHTYSLIHDDLPEMDNDDLRRGKPTNHKVFGQDIAVLAGDALLTEAIGWLAETNLAPELQVKLIKNLSQASGANGMVAGQTGDILGEQKTLTLTELMDVHRKKTGMLLEYACVAGGLLVNADEQQSENLRSFGQNFGLAFQIYDDILDVVSTTEKMGKKVHKDLAENKNTFPRLLGLDQAYEALNETLEQARKNLAQLAKTGFDVTLLAQLLGYFEAK